MIDIKSRAKLNQAYFGFNGQEKSFRGSFDASTTSVHTLEISLPSDNLLLACQRVSRTPSRRQMRLFTPLKSTISTACASHHGMLSAVLRRRQLLSTRSSGVYSAFRQRRVVHTIFSNPLVGNTDGWRCNNTNPFLQPRVVTLNQKRRNGSTNSPPDKPEKELKLKPKSKLLSRLPVPVHENIYTVPNILTFSRLLAAPAVGYLLVHNHHTAALSLFAYAGITDLIDGYIARRYNLQTVVGTIIDPAADKLLMTISVVCLALNGWMPAWLAVLILGRDVGLSISAIYYRWISLPPPKTMARYWDFSLPSAEVKPTAISKVNTALQLLLVGSSIALPVLPESLAGAWGLYNGLVGLQLLVAATTVWSGLSYVFSKDAVKILSDKEIQQRIARASKNDKK
ncbi:phosphatidyl synthase [Talaromyces stipitatus ATCC 10500]|uniref:Phosphatidyl synthase n=1 Tax=Talaromyces stipitatus (strain ATCC 10500 / CBS 375.48 / QM 6759 / NRRL 1006) TaxID=441959 RepID=B8MTU2_TALSN|nr:phosphatidyl synthase [Talaromyces stipitatus ATCC 10500]EED12485.1 phosphatidyl synthase [Talaromyces stipitatus ATCC 10500]